MVKLTDHVKLKAGPKESEDELHDSEKFVLFFPTFIWAVRDFTLQLQVDGKEISEDEYLEEALKLKAGKGMVLCCWRCPAPDTGAFQCKSTTAQARSTCSVSSYPTGSSQETQRYNQPRECIRQFFPDRKCFAFDQPASRKDLVCLEDLQDDEINPEFQQQVEKFCSYVWEKSPPKTVPGGHILTGNREFIQTLPRGLDGQQLLGLCLGKEQMQSQMMQVGKGRDFLLAAVPAAGFEASGCCRWGGNQLGKDVQEDSGREAAGIWQDPGPNGSLRFVQAADLSSLVLLGRAGETGNDLRGDHPERGSAVPGECGARPGRD